MKVVMTLLARDAADIVDAQVAFHLNAGVDFVVATDNLSCDGTTQILERYERSGVLHLIREDGKDMRQAEWVTRMARLAATDFDADWVINADADEFWWPRTGTLKAILAAVPDRFGVVRAGWRHFVPRPDDGRFFAERMTARLRWPAHPGDKRTVFHAHQKVAHRGDARVVVEAGNHDVYGPDMEPLRSWLPIEVLHFSFRGPEQLKRKASGGWQFRDPRTVVDHQARLRNAWREHRIDDFWARVVVDDDALERGIERGRYATDTRLRDALRQLGEPNVSFGLNTPAHLSLPSSTVVEDADFAAELAPLWSIEGIARAENRVAALDGRLAAIERTWPTAPVGKATVTRVSSLAGRVRDLARVRAARSPKLAATSRHPRKLAVPSLR
jgi:hypothetical protein